MSICKTWSPSVVRAITYSGSTSDWLMEQIVGNLRSLPPKPAFRPAEVDDANIKLSHPVPRPETIVVDEFSPL